MSYPPPGRHPARGLVPVFVSVRAGGRSFIVFGDQQRRIAECDDDCQFWAWPGAYRVRLNQSEHEPETSVRLRVRHGGSYELRVGDQEVRDGGLVLGVLGSVVAVVGTAVLLAGVISEECAASDSGDTDSCSTSPAVYYGLGTLAVGAAMTTAGFALYGTNQTGFQFRSEPMLVPITASVGPVPLPHGGLGLGATLSF
jgi:hypothetical protein